MANGNASIMKKKMLAVFICLVMVAGLIPTVAFAAENEVDVWDGTSDTSWYNETDTEFHIKTAEQLAGLAELTNIGIDTGASTGNTFENKIIYLDCDLDLGDYPWTPITNRNVDDGYFFKGTFDGQGHDIQLEPSWDRQRFFRLAFWLCAGRCNQESECCRCGFERQ